MGGLDPQGRQARSSLAVSPLQGYQASVSVPAQPAPTYGNAPSSLSTYNNVALAPAAPAARAADNDDMAHHTASHPSVVEIPMAKVIRGTARYIVKVSTVDGRQWAVAKRFSEFFDLKTEVRRSCGTVPRSHRVRFAPDYAACTFPGAQLQKHASMMVDRLHFPAKATFGGSSDGAYSRGLCASTSLTASCLSRTQR